MPIGKLPATEAPLPNPGATETATTPTSADESGERVAVLDPSASAPLRRTQTRHRLPIGASLAGGRLTVLRALGEGGMGLVYEALDRERDVRVALKTFSRLGATSVYDLKAEFRVLADVVHPNLVGLHELFAEGETYFFTMDLVAGVTFDDWVRRGPAGPTDQVRLRDALGQLVDAVDAIHAAGKVHRDLKPTNVLVTREGRVVVLDFGLAVDRELEKQQPTDELTRGTPTYMAPEQLAGMPATVASDLYALGVMLFEALTGRAPFEGPTYAMTFHKLWLNAPLPSAFQNVPAEFEQACVRLLAREPSARPELSELRDLLGLRKVGKVVLTQPVTPCPASGLLGRALELSALRDAFRSASEGRTSVLVLLRGESGIGKSALVDALFHDLRNDTRALVLAGRCFERESVPFKAFDLVVDELSRQLLHIQNHQLDAIVPEDAFALSQMFPVLGRIPAIARAPSRAVLDAHELRRRAFIAFGELLSRLCGERTLVIHLDDLQWSDLDSTMLLLHLLRQPDVPRLLLIASHRNESVASHAALAPLYQALSLETSLDIRPLSLGPLPRELARQLLGTHREHAEPRLLDQAGGNPFLLRQLARYAAKLEDHHRSWSWDAWIASQTATLSPDERLLLETLAVASRPIPLPLAADAALLSTAPRPLFESLRAQHLVRATGDRWLIECFHDRVREALLVGLSPGALEGRHRALAEALLRTDQADPEQVADHWVGAGELLRAAEQTVCAAERASKELGFDRAARLYAQALDRGSAAPGAPFANRVDLWRALARACEDAGRPLAAADAWQRAASMSNDPSDSVRAAEALWATGAVEEGKGAVRDVLVTAGLDLTSSDTAGVFKGLWWRLRARALRVRGPQAAPLIPADERLRCQLCFAVGGALALADAMGAYALQGRAVYEATRSGVPEDLVRAMGPELIYRGATGRAERERERIRKLLIRAAHDSGSADSAGFSALCLGQDAMLRGELRSAEQQLAAARSHFRSRNSLGWLSKLAARNWAWVLWLRGQYGAFGALVPSLISSAREAGDRLSWMQLAALAINTSLLQGDADNATKQIAAVRTEAGPNVAFATAFIVDRAAWQLELYRGDHVAARSSAKRLRRVWRPVMHFAHVRVEHLWFETLRQLAEDDSPAATRLARRDARRLLGESLSWPRALGYALLAAASAREGNVDASAELYNKSATMLEALGFDAHAEAARVQRARVRCDDAQEAEFGAKLRARGVVDLPRWLSIVIPGPATSRLL